MDETELREQLLAWVGGSVAGSSLGPAAASGSAAGAARPLTAAAAAPTWEKTRQGPPQKNTKWGWLKMKHFQLVKAPGKKQQLSSSDEFLLKPTRENKTNLKQMEEQLGQNAGFSLCFHLPSCHCGTCS